MITQPPVTILKPIDEVVEYVMDTTNWTQWGYMFIKAESAGDVITATYKNPQAPTGEEVVIWQVKRGPSGQNQKVIFWNEATGETVEYKFVARANH